MTKRETEELYTSLLAQNGQNEQLMVAIEEMSELTKELTKMSRGNGSTMKLTEEIADVSICLEQIKLFFNIEDKDIELFKQFKLKRLEHFYIKPVEEGQQLVFDFVTKGYNHE